MLELQPVGTACAFLSSLCGLKLVPSRWRYLTPPTSHLKGHNASRWAAKSFRDYRIIAQNHVKISSHPFDL
jgi:hypothetical protein